MPGMFLVTFYGKCNKSDLHAMRGTSPDVIVTEELPIKLADVPLL